MAAGTQGATTAPTGVAPSTAARLSFQNNYFEKAATFADLENSIAVWCSNGFDKRIAVNAVQAVVVVAVKKPQTFLKTEKGRNRNEYCVHCSKVSSRLAPANLILAVPDC